MNSPAPWKFFPENQLPGDIGDLRGSDGYIIAQIGRELRNGKWQITKLDRANAALIAASPDLLAAAEVVLAALESDLQNHRREHIDGCGCFDFEPEVPALKAAIAKAKGSTQ